MLTFQDFEKISENEKEKTEFVKKAISEYKSSELYNTAVIAEAYDSGENVTISNYQKILYNLKGEAVPDNWSSNWKMKSRFFYRFTTQQNQFLLGNGVTWEKSDTEKKLGDDFNKELQEGGKSALVSGVSYGFWNLDHLEVFKATEFVPIYDEENGALMCGIRFWQVADNKPLRATLYEIDGYTEFIWRSKDKPDGILTDKKPYILHLKTTKADGDVIYDGENYPTFPIVPLWANNRKKSELVGIREQIDCYDLIKSGFANDVDDASQIYWIIQNAGGMDDVDLAKFLDRVKTVGGAVVEEDGAQAEPHTIDVPTEARAELLRTLREDLYDDYMALDTKNIANGAVTATQIEASYEPLNNKTDEYEYCVVKFIKDILELAGVDDSPTFTRSIIINANEAIQNVLQSAQYLDDEYVTKKILDILGDSDKAESVLQRITDNDVNMYRGEVNAEGRQGAEGVGE